MDLQRLNVWQTGMQNPFENKLTVVGLAGLYICRPRKFLWLHNNSKKSTGLVSDSKKKSDWTYQEKSDRRSCPTLSNSDTIPDQKIIVGHN